VLTKTPWGEKWGKVMEMQSSGKPRGVRICKNTQEGLIRHRLSGNEEALMKREGFRTDRLKQKEEKGKEVQACVQRKSRQKKKFGK